MISRDIRSLFIFLKNITSLKELYFGDGQDNEGPLITNAEDSHKKNLFLKKLAAKYQARFQKDIRDLPHLDVEKRSFYQSLYDVYKTKADFAVNLILNDIDSRIIGEALEMLSYINKENKDNLDGVVSYLSRVIRSADTFGSNEDFQSKLQDFLSENMGININDKKFNSIIHSFVLALRKLTNDF